jgi:hypothetical protein
LFIGAILMLTWTRRFTNFHLWLTVSLGKRLVVRVGTSKGSPKRHMAAVHPGH